MGSFSGNLAIVAAGAAATLQLIRLSMAWITVVSNAGSTSTKQGKKSKHSSKRLPHMEPSRRQMMMQLLPLKERNNSM
jgi:hypothetical protein